MCPPKTDKSPASAPAFYRGDTMVPERTIGYLVKQLHHSLHRAIDREMAPLELTAGQWRPIALIAKKRADNPVDLAREAEVDTGAMTRTLDRLEAKGLLRRVRSENDRRRIRLELTADGQACAKALPHALAEAQNLHLRGISAEEVAQVEHILRRMIANGTPPE